MRLSQSRIVSFFISAVIAIFGLALIFCSEQQRARTMGGTATIELEPNRKLSLVTWKDSNSLWILTRQMREGEHPETWSFRENSSWGVTEGEVIIVEKENK